MKWKPPLFFTILVLFTVSSLNAAELVKVGTYDFQSTIQEMSVEPYLRARFPEALGEPLFVSLMLKDRISNRTFSGGWSTQAENYGKQFIQTRLWETAQKTAENYQKSGKMKNDLILGLSLSHQYRGYSIILKPQDGTLYDNTDLGSAIASVLADYLSRGPQESQVEESTDGTNNPEALEE